MKFWRYGVWLLALGLGGWTLAQLPLAEIGGVLTGLNFKDWVLWLALNGVIIALGTQRWWLLVAALGTQVAWLRLLAVRQAGQAVSFVTPGPQFGGEPLQVYWLCRSAGSGPVLPANAAVLSLILDRFYELTTNLTLLLLGVVWLMFSPAMAVAAWPRVLLILSCLLLGALGLAAWMTRTPPRQANNTGRWRGNTVICRNASRAWQRLSRHWHHHRHNGQQTLARLARDNKRHLFGAFAVALLGWLALLAEMYLLLIFAGVEPTLQGFVLLLVAQRLAMLLPVPGGIGTVEAAVFWTFQLLDWPASAALGFIALMRLRDAVILLLGLAVMHRLQALKTSVGKRPSN